MKRYRFVEQSILPESLVQDPEVQELVRKMSLDALLRALDDVGLTPTDATQAAGALLRHANDSMAMPYDATKDDQDKDLEKMNKIKQRREKGQMEGFGMGSADSPITTFYFRDEEEEPDEWPYDAATKGVMNSPLSGGPRMTT